MKWEREPPKGSKEHRLWERCKNAARGDGYKSLREFSEVDTKDLLRVPNLGKQSVAYLKGMFGKIEDRALEFWL